ncbi:hypothetical protein [Flavobacterium coralii]|uniref:hypothetical protein n=1 Tax=Flavobacterium coralii TaxID=2838017 RepID=UPI000C53D0B1|nr:hypothetical protein [Flavobacterium sp.]|tara:strand:- start:23221 stop:23517 length:297 start_codon:yes stop_codon:yes gene_type:complete
MNAKDRKRAFKKCNNSKTSYATYYDAAEALRRIRQKSNAPKKPVRAYKCECGKYHLTSMPIADANTIKKKVDERVKKREERFINRETEYWKKRFKIRD